MRTARRYDGNDDGLTYLAKTNAAAIGAGHRWGVDGWGRLRGEVDWAGSRRRLAGSAGAGNSSPACGALLHPVPSDCAMLPPPCSFIIFLRNAYPVNVLKAVQVVGVQGLVPLQNNTKYEGV